MLLAAGGAAVSLSSPLRALAACGVPGAIGCDGTLGQDPRALRGGNLPAVFSAGHWLRDKRLSFGAGQVTVAPSACDSVSGSFPVLTDNGAYDVIIVGSGMSGLSAAFYLLRNRPGTRVLLLDGNPVFGGNAGRDDAAPIPMVAATGGAYAVSPYDDFLFEIYGQTGIDWESAYVPDPFYSYFFDSQTPYAIPGAEGWTLDVYGKGLSSMPYPAAVLHDLQQAKQDFRNWYARHGCPTDPADRGDPKFDYLAQMSLHDYLTKERGFHPAVSDFYTRYSVDALAGVTADVNAYSSISFLGAEYNPIFALPGGTSAIARHVLKWLIPDALSGTTTEELLASPIDAAALDHPSNLVRVRQCAMVLRVDTGAASARAIYLRDGQFHAATAQAIIFAGQSHTAQHAAGHLMDATTRAAWDDITLAPVITANVVLNRAAPLVDLGLGYNNYWWGSEYWADFVIADWVGPNRMDPDRPTVLTFYGANFFPPADMPKERGKLLKTPFAAYEQSLRDDLSRILAATDFDFDSDVSDIYLYRWGHGMVFPKVGFPFGPPKNKNGQVVRTPGSRHIARAPIGRISFAGQDVESSPAIESALGSGLRTALEVLPLIS